MSGKPGGLELVGERARLVSEKPKDRGGRARLVSGKPGGPDLVVGENRAVTAQLPCAPSRVGRVGATPPTYGPP